MEIIQKRTWAEIDLDAAAYNLAAIRERIGEKAKLCCVIKADAYGHGAVRLAKEYEALGADWLAISNIEEAIQLRRAGITLPMLVLGFTPPEAASLLAENNISQCAYSLRYCKLLSENAEKNGVSVKIHIKVDTGMSRLGFYFQDLNRDTAVVLSLFFPPCCCPKRVQRHEKMFALSEHEHNQKYEVVRLEKSFRTGKV